VSNTKHVKTEIPSLTESIGRDATNQKIVKSKGKTFTSQFCLLILRFSGWLRPCRLIRSGMEFQFLHASYLTPVLPHG